MNTFVYDEKSGFDVYALVLPVTRQKNVASKFLCLLLLDVAGILFGLLLSLLYAALMSQITQTTFLKEISASLLISGCLGLDFGSAALALIYRFGSEKARILFILCFFLPAGLLIGLYQILEEQINPEILM